jgi:hypothetical protein
MTFVDHPGDFAMAVDGNEKPAARIAASVHNKREMVLCICAQQRMIA